MTTFTIGVIGAGPAGIAASLQLNKFGLFPLIFEMNRIGGLILDAYRVDNYPGFPDGISGWELGNNFKKHLLKDNKVIFEEIKKIDFVDETFFLSSDLSIYNCKYLIIATGTKPKVFEPIFDFSEITEKVFYDIAKLGSCNSKTIVIIGGGDLAFDYALSLARNNEVVICNRSNRVKCNHQLFLEATNIKKIKYMENVSFVSAKLDLDEKILCKFEKGCNSISINCDYMLIAIGRLPNNDLLSPFKKDFVDNLISSKRLYLIGDVANGDLRQVAISVGDGSKAAMDLYFQLKKRNQ